MERYIYLFVLLAKLFTCVVVYLKFGNSVLDKIIKFYDNKFL